jgi:hypothetical protein
MYHIRSQWFALCSVCVGLALVGTGCVFFAAKETQAAVMALEKTDFAASITHARRAQQIVVPLNFLSFDTLPLLSSWQLILQIPEKTQQLVSAATALIPSPEIPEPSLAPLLIPVASLEGTLTQLETTLAQTPSIQQKYAMQLTQLKKVQETLSLARIFLQQMSTGSATWVVLLQNTDELRATGGFAGSYALITIRNGVLEPPVIEDIYDADGQFTGYVAAPAGVREYTSSNKGLRLPDANWYPEFAQSAQTMLQFFALGNKRSLSGMAAVNLSVAEDLLRLTGPLYIPDYNVNVSAENLHQALREERSDFFPGSIQKKHILSLTLSILQARLTSLPTAEKQLVFTKMLERMHTKDIQLYAVNPDLQAALLTQGLSPALQPGLLTTYLNYQADSCATTQCPHLLFSLIESNVGINKVNRAVERTVKLTKVDDTQMQGSVTFHNTALAQDTTLLAAKTPLTTTSRVLTAQNGYANYQRIITSPELTITELSVAGKKITPTPEDYTTPSGVPVHSVGFLLPVLPQSEVTLEFTLTLSPAAGSLSDYALFIFKQSGLTPALHTLTTPTQNLQFTLSSDAVISLK